MNNNVPIHVAIIPDGNRRWAAMKGRPNIEGHEAGAERMFHVIDLLMKHGVKFVTVWGFSSDNWKRKKNEVQDLFLLLERWIIQKTGWAQTNGVRLKHIGRIYELPESLQKTINNATIFTANNTNLILNVAFNYSGRTEIIDAIRKLLSERISVNNLDEKLFAKYLDTSSTPDVDLVIRTAGEYRISNFMLWQTAYSEYYFTPTYWPDFDEQELDKALEAYSQRRRRLGGD